MFSQTSLLCRSSQFDLDAAIGMPEIWIYQQEQERVKILALWNGRYIEVEFSAWFHFLSAAIV